MSERPRLFSGDIPEEVKRQNDGIQAARRESIALNEDRLAQLQKVYDATDGDPEFGQKTHLRDELLALRTELEVERTMAQRYEEDPSRSWNVDRIEQQEIERKIMEDMGYSEKMLGYKDQYIASLRQRQGN